MTTPATLPCGRRILAARRLSEDLLAAGRGDPLADQKAQLAVGFSFDALAPTNFLATNPAALKKAFETGGASLLAGAGNLLDDWRTTADARARSTRHRSSWAANLRQPRDG
jgi:polyhydroxyalkanoate synthase